MKVGTLEQLDRPRTSVVFEIDEQRFLTGFAVKHDRNIYAYINRCPHNSSRLDWVPGEVFDESGRHLICATHGAIFEPGTGKCVNGPCVGQSLLSLSVKVEHQNIYVEIPSALAL